MAAGPSIDQGWRQSVKFWQAVATQVGKRSSSASFSRVKRTARLRTTRRHCLSCGRAPRKLALLGDALEWLGLGFDAILQFAAVGRQQPNDLVLPARRRDTRPGGREINELADPELVMCHARLHPWRLNISRALASSLLTCVHPLHDPPTRPFGLPYLALALPAPDS